MSGAPGAVPPGQRSGDRAAGAPSQPFFTAPLRGGVAGPDTLARWERVLGRERSLGYAAAPYRASVVYGRLVADVLREAAG